MGYLTQSMKQIPLTKNKFVLVDDSDFEWLNQWKWCFHSGYAVRRMPFEASRFIYMHRLIASPREDEQVDHINMDRLDNRRENLRVATKSQNMQNRGKQMNNTSGFKGVSLDKRKKNKKWRANIHIGTKDVSLGYFLTPEEAAIAYNMAALEHHGAYARINDI